MMTNLCCDVLTALKGKTLVTAESCTGGGIGAALTAIPGSSEIYKGGVICYTNEVKENVLGVDAEMLSRYGAVSQQVAQAMAVGVRKLLQADISVSVTGLAGPGADAYGNCVGTVYIGYDSDRFSTVKKYHFDGDRDQVRIQAIREAVTMILQYELNTK